MEAGLYGRRGSPWEFNLRDVFRWCELMLREQQATFTSSVGSVPMWEPWLLVDTLYIQRMRTRADRDAVLARFKEAFPEACVSEARAANSTRGCRARSNSLGGIGTHPVLKVTAEWLQAGQTVLPRGCWANVECRAELGGDELKAGLPMPLALRRPLQALARYDTTLSIRT